MKTSKAILTLIAVVNLTLAVPAGVVAARQPGQLQVISKKGEPFKGKVEAVDIKARTLTVAGTVILVSDATKLTKKGDAIELKDIKAGDHVHGRTRTNTEGKAEAINVTVVGENE